MWSSLKKEKLINCFQYCALHLQHKCVTPRMCSTSGYIFQRICRYVVCRQDVCLRRPVYAQLRQSCSSALCPFFVVMSCSSPSSKQLLCTSIKRNKTSVYVKKESFTFPPNLRLPSSSNVSLQTNQMYSTVFCFKFRIMDNKSHQLQAKVCVN